MTTRATSLAGMALPREMSHKTKPNARGNYGRCKPKTGNSGTIPFVVEYSPDPIWKAGASFRLFDVVQGLIEITQDGITAAAWPIGMRFARAGEVLEVRRLGDDGGPLVLVPVNGRTSSTLARALRALRGEKS